MLNIDLELVRAFVATATRPTFAAAAAAERVTVSAISHKMKALEGQLGVALFERVGRRAVLTEAGRALLAACRGPLEQLGEALDDTAERARKVAGEVHLGGPRGFVRHALMPALARLLEAHAELTLTLTFDVPSALERSLVEGALELAVLARPAEHPGLEAARVGQETFVAAASPRHPLAHAKATAAELSRHGAVVFDADLAMHAPWWRASFGRRAPLPPLIRSRAASLDAMAGLIERGVVWGVLPDYLVDPRAMVVLPPVVPRGAPAPRPATRDVFLAWRRDTAITARFAAVRGALLGR